MISYAYRGVRVIAGGNADPLFHKKVTVEGANEDLSFNILIPLPTSPQPPQGSSNLVNIIILKQLKKNVM